MPLVGRFNDLSASMVKRQMSSFRQFLASVGRVKLEMCGFSLIRRSFGFQKCSRFPARPAVVRFSGLSCKGAAFGRFNDWSVSRVKRQVSRFRQFLSSVGRVKRERCGFRLIQRLFGFQG